MKALAGLLIAMAVYCFAIVPAIEPAQQPEPEIPLFSRTLGGERWWQDFFPEGSWQTQDPKIIYTDKGILLSNSWTPINAKTWELKPLTIILPQSDSAKNAIKDRQPNAMAAQEMWIVSADEGATIHFEDPFEPFGSTTGTVPTVARGDLSGAIEVTRRSAVETSKKPWRLRTYDLTIDRRQLSTQRDVLIEWNESIIQGRALKILLRSDVLGSQGNASSAWGPLDELELYHVDKIDVALPPGGLWADLKTGELERRPELRTAPARLSATCGGRFAFDFRSSTATLQNGVHMKHFLGNSIPDEFLCDAISLTLEPPNKEEVNGQSGKLSAIRVKGFEATGVDSLRDFVGEKWVEVTAPTMDVKVRAKNLKVDLERQRIELSGRLDKPDATQSIVQFTYQGTEFRAPHLEYQAASPDQGSRHLGWLVADGPGELRTPKMDPNSAEPRQQTHVRWQESLTMTPAAESEKKQWIELVGNVLIESMQHGFLASERVEVWLQQRAEGSFLAAGSSATGGQTTDRYVPERLHAAGKTVLATPTLRSEISERLDVSLVYAAATENDSQKSGLALSDSAGNPMYQWVTPPTDTGVKPRMNSPVVSDDIVADGTASRGVDRDPQTVVEPVTVSGSTLTTTIISAGNDNWIDQLQISGPVRVWKDAAPQVGVGAARNIPWHIEGSRLILATNPAGQADMQIEGQPAKIVVAEGSLEGATIRFDQAHNLVWMNQPGEFTIPISALRRQPKTDGSPQVEWFNAPHCRWKGRMIFDGSVARIEGDIEIDAAFRSSPQQFWWVKAMSQQLDIQLSSAIDLNKSGDAAAEIERIILSNNVNILASELDANANRKSREQIVVPSLTFYIGQGQIVGAGPGWIKSNYASEGPVGKLAPSGNVSGPAQLQGAHLQFRDSMVGFLERNEVVFDGKVKVGAGPIASWDDSMDVSLMKSLTEGQFLLDCDQLKVYDTSHLSSLSMPNVGVKSDAWEFQATGNVAFNGEAESGEYLGAGYQIKYVQAKEQLLLYGDGRIPAWLQRVPNNAAEGAGKIYVESVEINPRTLEMKALKMGQGGFRIDMGQPAAPVGEGSGPLQRGRLDGPPNLNLPSARQDFYKRDR